MYGMLIRICVCTLGVNASLKLVYGNYRNLVVQDSLKEAFAGLSVGNDINTDALKMGCILRRADMLSMLSYFFDVLLIRECPPLLNAPYTMRRSRGACMEKAANKLRGKGLVLKSEGKAHIRGLEIALGDEDYVAGYGDTIDLVVVAAAWDKDRSGGSSGADVSQAYSEASFCRLLHASYGLSREQLEEFNFWIRADGVDASTLPNARRLASENPILVELCGAGFTKSLRSKRSFTECLTLRGLQTIAYESVGHEARDADRYKDLDEWVGCLWGKQKVTEQEKAQNEEKR
ncbi:hypothetical protein BU15DRAFT_69213 [Melanogaster broomeanus]|nr:hypothetical protein BU15DRAFT_69213 [Melanogaster broomeanus]